MIAERADRLRAPSRRWRDGVAIVAIVAAYLIVRELIGILERELWPAWPDPQWMGTPSYWAWGGTLAIAAVAWPAQTRPRLWPAPQIWTRTNVIVVAISALVINEAFYGWPVYDLVVGNLTFHVPRYFTNAMILAPFVEEWLFRGVLWDLIAARLSGRAATVVPLIATSMLFGVWHWASIFQLTWSSAGGPLVIHIAYGMFLGLLRWRLRSIGPGMLLHSFGNGWSAFARM